MLACLFLFFVGIAQIVIFTILVALDLLFESLILSLSLLVLLLKNSVLLFPDLISHLYPGSTLVKRHKLFLEHVDNSLLLLNLLLVHCPLLKNLLIEHVELAIIAGLELLPVDPQFFAFQVLHLEGEQGLVKCFGKDRDLSVERRRGWPV